MSEKTGLIDVGGGLRAVYGAGVLDACLDRGIAFDYCIGVSAGSANAASYLAHQKGRNLRFYRDYPLREQYMGVHTLLKTGSAIDLNYVYSVLSNTGGEDPLDYDALMANPAEFRVVATDAVTGRPVYFSKADLEPDNYGIFKASSCLPVVCRPMHWRGRAYYDGGISDPVPVRQAFADGCTRVVLVLTKPLGTMRAPATDAKLARALSLRYPNAGKKLAQRAERYNNGVALARRYAAQGRVLIVAPDDCCGVDTLTKDPLNIEHLYKKGLHDAAAISDFLKKDPCGA